MNHIFFFSFLLSVLSTPVLFAQLDLDVDQLPPIPDDEGFAGMYAGVSNGALLCMGGANFPDGMPWEEGVKKWYDHIFVLEHEKGKWQKMDEVLPSPVGYGVSVNFRDQIILIGGSNSEKHSDQVLGIRYEEGQIKFINKYPRLPFPLAMMCGALVDHTVYIAGGLESSTGKPVNRFLALDLSQPVGELQWKELPSWPGPPRQLAIAASMGHKFYLFSGINTITDVNGDPDRKLLTDAYLYDPVTSEWHDLPTLPRAIAAGPSPAPVFGDRHIVFPGGLDAETARYVNPQTHPGFLEDIWSFDTKTHSYSRVGILPEGASRLTLPTTWWKGQWILPNGESGPGVRSPEIYTISVASEFDPNH